MCLAVPAKVLDIAGSVARVSVNGVEREASLMLLPEAKLGDYVLVHAALPCRSLRKKTPKKRTRCSPR